MPVLAYIMVAFGAYLLGSLPTGFLVARAKGVDIRTVGSKNMGATNVFRVLGKGPGILVLLVDALKGFAAVAITINFYPEFSDLLPSVFTVGRLGLGITAGFFSIIGHNYTCWLGFQGGKGIATTGGVLVALVPWAFLVGMVTWILFVVTTRFVSVASIAAAASLPFATWLTTHDLMLTIVTGAMGALAIYKHKANIKRLRNGTESRFEFKKKDAKS